MTMGLSSLITPLFLILLTAGFVKGEYHLKFINNCQGSLWLGFNPEMPDFIEPQISQDTLVLFVAPDKWSGMIWARTNCTTDSTTGIFKCETGDCGDDQEDCNGKLPVYPVTLANLDINNPVASYQVNLNHGWNVPVRIQLEGSGKLEPGSGSGPCPTVDCRNSILNNCLPDLITKGPDGFANACMSACDKYGDDQSCCKGPYSGSACWPTQASKQMKYTCPLAHTYPADNDPPTYACRGADAIKITFCPLSN